MDVGGENCLDFDEGGGEAEAAGLDGGFESGDDFGIEAGDGEGADAFHGEIEIHGGLIGAIGGDGVERVGDGDDARHQRDLVGVRGRRGSRRRRGARGAIRFRAAFL